MTQPTRQSKGTAGPGRQPIHGCFLTSNDIQLPFLEKLYHQGRSNQLDIQMIGKEQLKEIEPHVNGLAAIYVPTAGIVDYNQVCRVFQKKIHGDLLLNTKVERVQEEKDSVHIETSSRSFHAKFLINCGGLYSDRVARRSGVDVDLKIVPFRGEYYKLKPEKERLVNNLIYPVPNPNFPFLGVHFTRMIGGGVKVGPNAVLGLKREGYNKTDFSIIDTAEVLTYPGFWKLAVRYWKDGIAEMVRSFSKKAFVRSLQQLLPEIGEEDLEPAPAGVRAQALKPDGTMVDDFHLIQGKNSIHVCNAPSPAATASIEIGKEIVSRISEVVKTKSLSRIS
ncbi:L-2-hydroxyglutarate oxidase [Polycladomyces subterraneus]|uniref:L-2-hydroxyglutarate oxidase n=1 Tax=Polycladomyces subterraneus TaxID=1016997 RepID=UPI003F4DEC59